jgi:hypothetical protein
MHPLDTLAALPQFVTTDAPRTVYNVLSNCFLTEASDSQALVLKSGSQTATLAGEALSKYLKAADMQATLLLEGKRG